MPIILIRPARDTDLAQIYDVFQENEVGDLPTVPPPGGVPSDLRHTLATGTMHVAEQDGCVLAYAAAITRGPVAFLTDQFVRPAHQSAQLGAMLLRRVLPQDERIHCTFSSTDPCTFSSTDPRALALYIRVGMRPQWPHFNLRLDGPLRTDLPPADVEIVEAGSACLERGVRGSRHPRDGLQIHGAERLHGQDLRRVGGARSRRRGQS